MFNVVERIYGIEEEWDSEVARFAVEDDAVALADQMERSGANVWVEFEENSVDR